MVEHIRREAANAKAGKKAGITAKFNSLVDEGICEELYAASQAGVDINLIVRGMCILRAGVKGLSDRIKVHSLVGRLLEHSRIYRFENAGKPVFAIASADWMTRNLDRRVEAAVVIDDAQMQERLMTILKICLEDDVAIRDLQPDGSYVRRRPRKAGAGKSAYVRLCAEAASRAAAVAVDTAPAPVFRPRRKGDRTK